MRRKLCLVDLTGFTLRMHPTVNISLDFQDVFDDLPQERMLHKMRGERGFWGKHGQMID